MINSWPLLVLIIHKGSFFSRSGKIKVHRCRGVVKSFVTAAFDTLNLN